MTFAGDHICLPENASGDKESSPSVNDIVSYMED